MQAPVASTVDAGLRGTERICSYDAILLSIVICIWVEQKKLDYYGGQFSISVDNLFGEMRLPADFLARSGEIPY